MGFRAIAFLVLLLLSSTVSAQESGVQNERRESGGSLDLGRRSKINLNLLEALGENGSDGVVIGLNVDSGLGIFDAFVASFSMILVSEIGDETFIIAALMAMRHPKSIVLSGALSALVVMTILSTGLGRIVPNLISRKHTNSAATVLYLFFGLRLLYIAWRSDPKGSQKKEIEEVEEKLESGQGKTTFRRFFSRFCTPIFLESFVLTFLAEWGDRSQIATIAVTVKLTPTFDRFLSRTIFPGGPQKGAKMSRDSPAPATGPGPGLVISTTPPILSFLVSASTDPHLSKDLQQTASKLSSKSNVPYRAIRALWVASRASTRPQLVKLFSGSGFVFTSPKPREKSEELKARLKELVEMSERNAYAELVKDITPRKDSAPEPFSSYKDQLGFGLHVVVTMFTGYLVGYAAFRALFSHSPVMNAAGGILGLVIGMLVETLIFIIQASRYDLKSSSSTSKLKKDQ